MDTKTTSRRYDIKAPKRLREAKGLSVLDAAKRAGVSPQALRYLEKGATKPMADTLGFLASAYGTTTDSFYIVKGEES